VGKTPSGREESQIDLFREKARELGCEQDQSGEDEVMKRLARQKRHEPPASNQKPKTKKPAK
jgi:hypothetical protein